MLEGKLSVRRAHDPLDSELARVRSERATSGGVELAASGAAASEQDRTAGPALIGCSLWLKMGFAGAAILGATLSGFLAGEEQSIAGWSLVGCGGMLATASWRRAAKLLGLAEQESAADVDRSAASISIRPLSVADLEKQLPALVALLRDTVNGGVPLGFLPPLTEVQSRNYWLSLRSELRAGSRVVLAACKEGSIVGLGQLSLSPWPNSRHRAELQKLFVATAQRGRGLGSALMAALHDAARQHGRSLLLLNTRRGEPPENFYKRLGYREVGVVPGWTVGPAGERYDHVTLYQELAL